MDVHDYYSFHHPRLWDQHCQLLNNLESQYSLSRPDSPLGEFRSEIHNKLGPQISFLCKGENFDLEGLCEYICTQNPQKIESDVACIYVSCALALASEFWLSKENEGLAWKFQCDAHYYYGLTAATARDQEFHTSTIVSEFQLALASQGGISKNSKYKKYQDRATEILKTKIWPSVQQAVIFITERLQTEFADDEEVRKAGGYRFTSVENWIKALPAEILDVHIPGYTERRRKGQSIAKKLNESTAE